MGGLLKSWVESIVQSELEKGLEWLKQKTAKSFIIDSSLFEDDGSNLRIKVTRAENVQIVKFTAFEKPEPIQAEISDSFTRVKVTFAASAVEKFNLEERKSITRDTLGSLIQILDFEIVATHIGPRPSRLTILIKRFKVLGSEGSAEIYFPRPIDNIAGILELLDKLKSFREHESSSDQEEKKEDHSVRSSIIESLDESTLFNDENSEICHNGFATQIPRSWHTGKALGKELKSFNAGSQIGLDSSPEQGIYAEASNGKSANSTPDPFKENTTNMPNLESGVGLHSTKRNQLKRCQPVAKGNRDMKAQELLSLLAGNQKTKPTIPTIPSKSAAVLTRPVQAATRVNQNPVDAKEVSKAFVMNAETKQEVNMGEDPSNLRLKIKKPAQAAPDVLLAPSITTFPHPPGPIKDKEVRILKDQKALLERSDCWIPAEPGQREPAGSIPIKILQVISEHAENGQREVSKKNRSLDQSPSKVGSQASRSTAEPETDTNEDSEPDVPIPRDEWPVSSPLNGMHEQLPPDSSAEVSIQDDINKEEPISKRRKLSSTSAFSHSTTPSRKGSIQESDDSNSSAGSSPISASGSVDKGPGLLKSSLSGRDESYLKPQGLEYDANRNNQNIDLRMDYYGTPKSEASIASWNICSRCHERFGLPADLFKHEKNSRCVADSRQIPESHINSDSSPIFATTNTQTLSENMQGCSNNDSSHQRTRIDLEVEDFSQVQIKGTQKDPDLRQSLSSLDSSLKSTSSEISNDINVSHSHRSRIKIQSDSANFNLETETSVPEVPVETQDLHINDAPTRIFPSTASQAGEPILQVKRTPYANGYAPKIISTDPVSDPSLSKKRVTDGTKFYQASKKPVILDISSDEALTVKHDEDPSPRKNTCDLNLESPIAPSTKKEPSVLMKRKQLEVGADFPHVTKRRKRPMRKISFDFSQDPRFMPDPSVLGSRHRQDFFNSRKLSMTDFDSEQRPDSNPKIATSPLSSQAEVDQGKIGLYDEEQKIEAAGPAISEKSSDVVMNDIASREVETAQEQNATVPPIGVTNRTKISEIFDYFHTTYPTYTATLAQFVAICKRIKNLAEADRMEHQSLWDDFIVRHKTEYPNYLRRCAETAEDPVPYEKFYRNEIAEPRFFSKIVTPKTLREALSLETPMDNRVSQQPEPGLAKPKSEPQRPDTEHAIIDLASDQTFPMAEENESFIASKNKSPRALPWLSSSEHCSNKKGNRAHSSQSLSKPIPNGRNSREKGYAPKSPASAKLELEISAQQWWKDHNTPFTNFVRAYTAIRSGNGNSYAIERSSKPGIAGDPPRADPSLERIDVSKWRL